MGMAYLPAIVIVSYYFEKRRTLATGIAVCGSGIGTFVFAPLANALLTEYSWKGTILIEAGILLNCLLCGMLFRPLKFPETPDSDEEDEKPIVEGKPLKVAENLDALEEEEEEEEKEKEEKPVAERKRLTFRESPDAAEEEKEKPAAEGKRLKFRENSDPLEEKEEKPVAEGKRLKFRENLDPLEEGEEEKPVADEGKPADEANADESKTGRKRSVPLVRIQEPSIDDAEISAARRMSRRMTLRRVSFTPFADPIPRKDILYNKRLSLQIPRNVVGDPALRRRFSEPHRARRMSRRMSLRRVSMAQLAGPMARKDVFYNKSLHHIDQYRADRDDYFLRMTTLLEEPEPEPEKGWLAKIGITRDIRHTLTVMMDFRLLLDVVFMCFAVAKVFTTVGFIVPYIFLPSRGIRLGFDSKQASWLMSVVGISSTLGRIVSGYIGDMACVRRMILYNSLNFLCGACSVLSVFLLTFPLQMCYSFTLGFFIGTWSRIFICPPVSHCYNIAWDRL